MKGIILIANYFEDIEALGTMDLLRRAKIEVDLVSITGSLNIITQSSLHITVDKKIEDVNIDEYDFLILPGGKAVMQNHLENELTKEIVATFMKQNKLVACICAAPSVLGKYEYLQDKTYTCFPSFEKLVVGGTYLENAKVVHDKNVITSKACGTTFEFAYEIIKTLKSEAIANHILDSVFYKIK